MTIKAAIGYLTYHIPDKQFIKIKYIYRLHKPLNLTNPKTINEKLQWLKLYDHRPVFSI